jgi:ADP-ribosylglycohydrolase
LLGTAIGDAWGLPAEGLPPKRAARIARSPHYRFAGRRGWISDDTEQTVLVAEAVALAAPLRARTLHLRRALRRWFWRLPFGLGGATLRAGLRLTFGLKRSGVRSAGNGAMMRAPILGLLLADPAERQAHGRAFAQLTHLDPRAVEGALYAAEICAYSHAPLAQAVTAAQAVLQHPDLCAALARAQALAADASVTPARAALQLGTTGYVVHSLGWTTYTLLRSPGRAIADTLAETIAAGGDADTHAAIVGAWLGARRPGALPAHRLERLLGGPFGPAHLRALGHALAHNQPPPRWSATLALLRNLAAWPVMLTHGFARLAGHPWR